MTGAASAKLSASICKTALLAMGLFAPAGTPSAIVDRMSRTTARIVQEAQTAARLTEIGVNPLGTTSQEFGAIVAHDIAFWREAVRLTGVQEK